MSLASLSSLDNSVVGTNRKSLLIRLLQRRALTVLIVALLLLAGLTSAARAAVIESGSFVDKVQTLRNQTFARD